MKGAVYLRVSTTEQDETYQREEIERYLRGHGLTVPAERWYLDKFTGKTMDRPAMQELERAIMMGEVDTVFFYDISRFARNLIDGLCHIDQWIKLKVRMVFVGKMHLDLQPDDYASQLQLKMMTIFYLAFAEHERERQTVRRNGGIEAARQKCQKIMELYQKGLTSGQIAAKVHMSCGQVDSVINRDGALWWGGGSKGKNARRIDRQTVIGLIANRYSIANIAKIMRVSMSTIQRRIRDWGGPDALREEAVRIGPVHDEKLRRKYKSLLTTIENCSKLGDDHEQRPGRAKAGTERSDDLGTPEGIPEGPTDSQA